MNEKCKHISLDDRIAMQEFWNLCSETGTEGIEGTAVLYKRRNASE